MKNLLVVLLFLTGLMNAATASAWDGFDADSADLVEIIPAAIPVPGDTVTVKNHDTDLDESCLVESVRRNLRTIEVVVAYPDGKLHVLVMEGL